MGLDRTAKKLSRRQHERDDADVCACGRDLSVGWRGECRDEQVGGVSAGTEWFRVVGTLGVAVSRGELDFDMKAASDGRRIYSDSERFSQWDCYGIGGLGGLFHYWHMCLGFDFLARFLDRDIDINGRSVTGSVERCPWMFRVYAGLEF